MLIVRARRLQEENVVEEGRINNARRRFELLRDEILFGVKLFATVFCAAALLLSSLLGPAPVAIFLSSSGTIAGIVSLVFSRRSS